MAEDPKLANAYTDVASAVVLLERSVGCLSGFPKDQAREALRRLRLVLNTHAHNLAPVRNPLPGDVLS